MLRNSLWYVVLPFILPLAAQENGSLGDVARQERARKQSDSSGSRATISQCSQGPISEEQMFAWQIAGMPAGEIAQEIASRGTSFASATFKPGGVEQGAVDPLIIATVAKAPHHPSQEVESEHVLLPLLRASEFFRNNDYRNAISALQDAIKQDQNSADLFSALGNLFLKSMNLEHASQSYRRATELEPNCAYAPGQLSLIYYRLERTRGMPRLRRAKCWLRTHKVRRPTSI